MKMKRTIRRLVVCAALILAIMAGATGNAFSETIITLDGVANNDAAGQPLTGVRVSGLTAPAAGQVCDAQAVVTSAEGMSWEIPVLWLDATGHVVEGVVQTTDLSPVLVFYLPEGYGMDGLSLTLGDDVAALFGPSVLSICNRKLGVTYIFPGNIDLSGIDGMFSRSEPDAPEAESTSRNNSHHQEETDDEEIFVRPVPPNPEPEPEPVDLVDLYCSQTAKDAVSAEDLARLVDVVVNRLEPQAVNLLRDSFPCFREAAENGELGGQIGLYIYFVEGDKDGIAAHEFGDQSGVIASVSENAWRDEADEQLVHFGYILTVGADNFVLSDENKNPVVGEDGKLRLSDDMTKLENFIIHEMFHAFMSDYNRIGQTGATSAEELLEYHENYTNPDTDWSKYNAASFPSWLKEGLASAVHNNYHYRFPSLWFYRRDPQTNWWAERFSEEMLLNACVNPEFELHSPDGQENTATLYYDLERADDPNINSNMKNESRYITGYLASLYLGELAARHNGGTSVHTDAETGEVSMDSEAIRLGLNDVLESLHNGQTLDEVIREISDGRFENTQAFEQQFIKGEAGTDGAYVGDDDSLDFCVTFLNYMLDLESDGTREYGANGSILRDFDEDYASPLDAEKTAESDLYKIEGSNDYVDSTVDRWTDGGKSLSGTPASSEVRVMAAPAEEDPSESLDSIEEDSNQAAETDANPDATMESAPELSGINAIASEDTEASSETSEHDAGSDDDADASTVPESGASDSLSEADFKESASQDTSEVESEAGINTTEANE